MPATTGTQATAVTQETAMTPATSNNKDDNRHGRMQEQE
jgi:hypothetical protein